jgi:hypothetical protein
MKTNSKLFQIVISFFAVLVFAAFLLLPIYTFFFQVGTAFSLKRLALSGLISTLVSSVAFYFLRKAFVSKKISNKKIIQHLIAAGVICGIYWLIAPIPQPFAFAPRSEIRVSINQLDQKSKEITQITYFNNGLEDISPAKLTFDPPILQNGDNKVAEINFDKQANSYFSWQGRSWKSIVLMINSSQPVDISVNLNGINYPYHLDQKTDLTIQLPAAHAFNFFFFQFLLFLSSVITIFLFISLISSIRVGGSKLSSETENRWPLEEKLPIYLFIGVFGIICVGVVSIGFQNRLYSDDYCYLNTLKTSGYFQAILYYLNNVYGRYTVHALDFLAYEFPSVTTFTGPISACLLIGGSLFYLFFELLKQYERKVRILFCFFFSISSVGTIFLVVPSLFDSFIWNLYSTCVSGSFAFFVIAITVLLKKTDLKEKKGSIILWSCAFFLWGLLSAGFIEVTTVLNAAVFGIIWLVIVFTKKFEAHRNIFFYSLSFVISQLIGLIILSSFAGSSSLIRMLFSPKISSVFSNLYTMFQRNFALIFPGNTLLPFAMIVLLVLGAYFCGKTLPQPLNWTKRSLSFLDKLLLCVSPFLVFFVAFFPLTFFEGYFPERTLAFPLCYAMLDACLAALILGNANRSYSQTNRAMSIIIVLLLGIVGYASIGNLVNFSGQMVLHRDEWDIRDQQIKQAVAEGKKEIEITPYHVPMGTDLSTSDNLWLTQCESDFYGINIVVNDKQE